MNEHPNLLIVHAHDMGRYNSAYGFQAPTPNMSRLAREGLVFRDAHCAAPTCSPSRAAMLTGLTAHEMGMMGLLHRGNTLNDTSKHLARRLSAEGYTSVRAGLQHEYRTEGDQDPVYDQVLEADGGQGNMDEKAARAAVRFLNQASDAEPWFMWVGLFYPHREFLEPDPERHNPNTLKVPDILPDTPEIREDMAGYLASVEMTDNALGMVLEALEESGQADHTLVVVTTDHGIAFPEMKCSLTGHGTGITWIMRQPGRIPAGVASDALVSHLDMVPTVLDHLGLPIPDGLHGRSFKSVAEDPASKSLREDVFAEVNVHAGIEPKRSVRTKTHSYIRIFQTDRQRVLTNTDQSISKSYWLNHTDWGSQCEDEIQLYDLTLDPQERRNVSGDPSYADILKEMEGRLEKWMRETHDPLLEGPLVVKAGSLVCEKGTDNPRENVVELTEDQVVP